MAWPPPVQDTTASNATPQFDHHPDAHVNMALAVNNDIVPKINELDAFTCPVGSLLPYVGATAPMSWLLADGAEVSRTQYPELFAVCGEKYGAGDGTTTFLLPNMTDRALFGSVTAYGGSNDAVAVAHTHDGKASATGHTHTYSSVSSGASGVAFGNDFGGVATTTSLEWHDHDTWTNAQDPSDSGSGKNIPAYTGVQFIIRAR